MLLFFQAIGDIAWLPILLIWFGFGLTTMTFVIVYTVLFPVVALNVAAWAEGYHWTPPALAGLVLVMCGNVLVFRRKAPPVPTAPLHLGAGSSVHLKGSKKIADNFLINPLIFSIIVLPQSRRI